MNIKIQDIKLLSLPLAKLVPLQGNLKTLSDDNRKKLEKSFKEKGLFLPFFVWQDGDAYRLLDGHGREKVLGEGAARLIGPDGKPTDQVPCVIVQANSLKDAKEKLLLISSQFHTITKAGFEEFAEDIADDWKSETLNFDAFDFGADEEEEEEQDEDTVPASPAKPITKKGDVWTMGEHRLMCADATDEKSWQVLMGKEKAHMVFTDPPYGVSYKANEPGRKGKNYKPIENDELTGDKLLAFLKSTFQKMTKATDNEGAFYIWHPSASREDFFYAMKAVGLVEKQYLIWVKPFHVIGHADYHWQHEPCFYAHKDGYQPKFYGNRSQFTVWDIGLKSEGVGSYNIGKGIAISDGKENELYVTTRPPKGKKIRRVRVEPGGAIKLQEETKTDGTDCWSVARDTKTEHPTQKPVALAARAIRNSSEAGDLVIDPFLGSGTTLIAAQQTGRRCYGFEFEPVYCDVIVKRWEQATGKKATRGS